MTDENLSDPLHRLSVRRDIHRPLSPDAQARIESRLDSAFSVAVAHADVDLDDEFGLDDVDVPVEATTRRARRRRWLAPATAAAAAAAVVVLVLGLVAIQTDDAPPPAADLPGLLPSQFPTELLRSGTRWTLSTVLDPEDETGAAAGARLTIRMQNTADGTARISTSDVPAQQFLGDVRFDLTPSGNVLVPVVLLDPQRAWIDCAATIDLNGAGSATCGSDLIEYTVATGMDEAVDAPLGHDDARPIDVDWSVDDGSGDVRTRLWISPTEGPVRIEISRDDSTRIFVLREFDTPDPSPATTTTGD